MAREAKYTERISTVITADARARLDAIEQRHPVSLNDVIREAIDAGLPAVEAKYAGAPTR